MGVSCFKLPERAYRVTALTEAAAAKAACRLGAEESLRRAKESGSAALAGALLIELDELRAMRSWFGSRPRGAPEGLASYRVIVVALLSFHDPVEGQPTPAPNAYQAAVGVERQESLLEAVDGYGDERAELMARAHWEARALERATAEATLAPGSQRSL